MNAKTNSTKVRYGVHYQDRNYEYALHSKKNLFLRNLADVVNILEYCVVQDLKRNEYKPMDEMFNFSVTRFVNDEKDASFDDEKFNVLMRSLVDQMVADNIQRNKESV